jgi:hypothetical protein
MTLATGATVSDDVARGPAATVFVADPTVEAEGIARALRTAGYTVVDVPQSMLVARVAVQHPRVVLVDADSEGALEVVARMRELPEADDIHVLFVARPGGAIPTPEEAFAHEGSGLFVRPVDIPALVSKVEALVGGLGAEHFGRANAPSPNLKKRPTSSPSLPPASMRASTGGLSSETASPSSLASSVPRSGGSHAPKLPSEPPPSTPRSARKFVGIAPPVSPELQRLLQEAEHRVQVQSEQESIVPSPEDEIEAVLPAELLASLDEPLEQDEDDDEVVFAGRSSPPFVAGREGNGDGPAGRNTTAAPLPQAQGGHRPAAGSVPPPTVSFRERSMDASTTTATPDAPANLAVSAATALGPGDAMRAIARAIASRATGSLCLAYAEGERRIVLREGDVVTTASTMEEESLLAFLGVRGDLPRETVRRLGAKFPPFGRHAGAALVARGYLRQDQMWPMLRAHAEWLLARLLQTQPAHLTLETHPPGRLASEPSVFGGSTGASVFVEIVRRVVPSADAIEHLGGLGSRVADGPEVRLLGECALGPAELAQVQAGRSLGEMVDVVPDGDLPAVLFALSQLGVIDVLRAVGDGGPRGDGASAAADVAALDEEAIRERVRARLQLVEDGDYFALLGVAPDVTGYEVRRAFVELRRAFDPARILTPEVVDLADDLRKIVSILEEAYEILKDAARRERYRRAIEAVPGL